jgi:hypothetical protein
MKREVKFRHTSGPMLVICDVCDEAKKDAGAVRVERSDSAGPYIQTICDACAVEISGVLMREYFTPDARAKAVLGLVASIDPNPLALVDDEK